jgi:hypothetical protein
MEQKDGTKVQFFWGDEKQQRLLNEVIHEGIEAHNSRAYQNASEGVASFLQALMGGGEGGPQVRVVHGNNLSDILNQMGVGAGLGKTEVPVRPFSALHDCEECDDPNCADRKAPRKMKDVTPKNKLIGKEDNNK